MERVVFKFAASAAIVMCAVGGAQAAAAAGEQQEISVQGNHSSRFDDFDRWKQLVVLAAFVDAEKETVTLRGLYFGKKTPTVFCETNKMKVVRWNETEVVVRFPKAVEDGTYLFTVARGNIDLERGEFFVTKAASGGETEPGRRGSVRACRAARSCGAAGCRWAARSRGSGRCGWPSGAGWCAPAAGGRGGSGWSRRSDGASGFNRAGWPSGSAGHPGCTRIAGGAGARGSGGSSGAGGRARRV